MAAHQQRAVVQGKDLVDFTDERRKVGHPARLWKLTPKANDRFSDCHAGLALGMLKAIRRRRRRSV